MHSDDLNRGNDICRLLMHHGKGSYREDLLLTLDSLTPFPKYEIKFQYLALIFHGYLVELNGKMFNKEGV